MHQAARIQPVAMADGTAHAAEILLTNLIVHSPVVAVEQRLRGAQERRHQRQLTSQRLLAVQGARKTSSWCDAIVLELSWASAQKSAMMTPVHLSPVKSSGKGCAQTHKNATTQR